MEHQKILNLLNETGRSNFVTRKWSIVNDQWNINYDTDYNTDILKSNLCDKNDAYILVKGNITIEVCNLVTEVAFKNCAQFTTCITNIDRTTKDDAEDLDLVMPMYNQIEYISNHSETIQILWFYSKDKATTFNNDIENTDDFKSFKYKAKLLGNWVEYRANGILRNVTSAYY